MHQTSDACDTQHPHELMRVIDAKLVLTLLRERGWTITDLANAAGMDRAWMSQLLNHNHRHEATPRMVARLHAVFPQWRVDELTLAVPRVSCGCDHDEVAS